jgi:D-alanyl-D-alanine carboxypeptidase/D-alanyl-D-alanine-endopeptidase (penicillin-binding protein 4)
MKKITLSTFLFFIFVANIAYASSILGTFTSLVSQSNLPLAKQSFCISNATSSIATYESNVRVIPASVSKLYTFDFALNTLGPNFRYTTDIYVNGTTLYINGGGDPHFVIENLRSIITQVESDQHIILKNFVFSPNFYFNWKTTPSTIIPSMITSLKEDSGSPIDPHFTVSYSSHAYTGSGTEYQFQSAPLSILIKQINDYSTNIAADTLFIRSGGPTAFAAYMEKTYGVDFTTIRFTTGSGLSGNYTTCALTLRVMQHYAQTAQSLGINMDDLMSMPRIDPGVLENTLLSLATTSGIVAKSGYVDYHHNYAGIAYTTNGPIYFAVFGGFTRLADGPKTEQLVENFISKTLAPYQQIPFSYIPDNDPTKDTVITLLQK